MACDCSAKRCEGAPRARYIEVGRPVDVGGRPACGRVSVHVRLLWTTLSVMVTIGCTYSFTQPAWYVHSVTRDRLGLFNYCVRDPRMSASISGPPKTLWPPRYDTNHFRIVRNDVTADFGNWEITVPNSIFPVLLDKPKIFNGDRVSRIRGLMVVLIKLAILTLIKPEM